MTSNIISNVDQLRSIYKQPTDGAVKKVLKKLDKHCRAFINLCPFGVLSTCGSNGYLDASPKGGEPGFIHVLDEETILVPDWPGNNRLDSLENILANPHVGLLLLVPGIEETLRINGRVEISTNRDMLECTAIGRKKPISVLVIKVEEAYLHCARAVWRAELWNAEKHIKRGEFPSMGQMLADQVQGYDAESTDKLIAENRYELYSSRD